MSGLPERDVERLAEALCRSGCINYDPDVQGGCSLCTEAVEGYQAPVVAAIRDEAKAEALREAADQRAARKIAADAADRFRDVLSECLGHEDENPGDDALVAELRKHFGRTGPEPTRWRDFCAGALAFVDQIRADGDGGDQ